MTEREHSPQERDVLPGRVLALAGAGVVAVTVILSLVAFGIVRADLPDPFEPPEAGTRPATLEAAHLRTALLLRGTVAPPHVEQAARARHWGWVDREAGVVHMPIEIAMQLRLQAEQPMRRSQ